MANIYSTSSDYWIKPGALMISLNALDDPQYLQSSVLSGAVIMAYKAGVIDYDSSHNYRKWNLKAENTLFHNALAKYVYAQLDKESNKSQALVVYSDTKLDITGKKEDSEEENSSFYYIYLGLISASSNNNGERIPRVWNDIFKFGDLATDKSINEETLGEWNKMFRLNKVYDFIEVLKDILSANVQTLFLGKRKVKIVDIQRSDDSKNEELINDNTIPTTKLLKDITENNFLSKKKEDTAEEIITFLKGLNAEDLVQANNGLVIRQQELVESAFMSLFEEGEDALVEEMSISEPSSGVSTLGELTNVADNADDTSETNDVLVRLAGSSDWMVDTSLFSKVTQLMTKVFPFTMTLLGGGTYEKGSTQIVTLSWTYDRDIEQQSINNELLLTSLRSKQYTGITSDTIYNLKAAFSGQTYTKSVSVQFKTKKYSGASYDTSLTNAQILSLSGTWAQRTQGSTVFDCTGGKYPYYILPTSMVSGIQFWIGGLRNTDWTEEVQEVTNAFGYRESYTIFRLNSIQTGILNIEVK